MTRQDLAHVDELTGILSTSSSISDVCDALWLLVGHYGHLLRHMSRERRKAVITALTHGGISRLYERTPLGEESIGITQVLCNVLPRVGIPVVAISADEIESTIGRDVFYYFRQCSSNLPWFDYFRPEDGATALTLDRINRTMSSVGDPGFAVFDLDWPIACLVQRLDINEETMTFDCQTFLTIQESRFLRIFLSEKSKVEEDFDGRILNMSNIEVRFKELQLPSEAASLKKRSDMLKLYRPRIALRQDNLYGTILTCSSEI